MHTGEDIGNNNFTTDTIAANKRIFWNVIEKEVLT